MEFVNHLGLAHLSIEPVVVAYFNWIYSQCSPDKKNEKIRQMLLPHLQKTLLINHLARETLIAEKNPLTNYLISTGIYCFVLNRRFPSKFININQKADYIHDNIVKGTLNGMKAFANKFKTLEYADICFPLQLKKRGFKRDGSEGLKGYFFRDDGFQLWDALYE